jgi:hypothetical protein
MPKVIGRNSKFSAGGGEQKRTAPASVNTQAAEGSDWHAKNETVQYVPPPMGDKGRIGGRADPNA